MKPNMAGGTKGLSKMSTIKPPKAMKGKPKGEHPAHGTGKAK